MKIVAIGDVYGRPGRKILSERMDAIRKRFEPDIVIVNGENSAGGRGINRKAFEEILKAGVDVVTMGNHTFDDKGVFEILDDERLVIPYNYPPETPGNRVFLKKVGNVDVVVVNMLGRVLMNVFVECPFRKSMEIYENFRGKMIIMDFHAEATSEKKALGFFLDGKFSLVFGTHTHVQTCDETILPNGTAYITDIGMTGGHLSVIGANKDTVIENFLHPHVRKRAEPSKQMLKVEGIFCILDDDGRAKHIERFSLD